MFSVQVLISLCFATSILMRISPTTYTSEVLKSKDGFVVVPSISCSLEYRRNFSVFHHFTANVGRTSFPANVSSSKLAIILLLAGDIALNPGPDSVSQFNFGFLNARSVRNKGAQLADLVNDHKLDLLAITEAWIKPDDTEALLADITPTGYVLHNTCRASGGGGGVCFLVRDHFKVCSMNIPSFDHSDVLGLSLKLGYQSYNFVVVYRPPYISNESRFLEDFQGLLEGFCAMPSETLIMGDFNFHKDLKSSGFQLFNKLLDACNLVQLIDFPTHVDGHTLDLAISPSDSSLVDSITCLPGISDHYFIKMRLNCPVKTSQIPETVTFRRFNRIDRTALLDDLQKSELAQFEKCSDASELNNLYHNTLVRLLDKHAPAESRSCLSRSGNFQVSPEMRSVKQLRRQAERQWRRHNRSSVFKDRYKRYVNRYNRLTDEAKKATISRCVNENRNDSCKLWKALNGILHRSQVSVFPDFCDLSSLAETFSAFFHDKIQKIRVGFSKRLCPESVPGYKPPLLSKFKQVPTDVVRKIILNSPKKSCSLDPWPTFLVVEYIDFLVAPITRLINLSLKDGLFPSCFKSALVSPLIKKASLPKNELKSYRPVSNLCFISKVLERVVAEQIKCHISENGLGNDLQSAYKSGHSTETALLTIHDDIACNMAQGKVTALTLLDLSAAFDTIDHKLLLERLSKWFGFSGEVLDWFKSYLENRKQAVKIGNVVSNNRTLTTGVPQGSVLGPLLFSLYTVPLSREIASFKGIDHHLYADDTQVYLSINPESPELDLFKLGECLSRVQLWMHDNILKLNPDKTEFILIGTDYMRKKFAALFPCEILGNEVLPADHVRNLGVMFDSDFSFSKHISNVCKSCYYHLKDLRRIRRFINQSDATILANALVSSRLDYCNSLLHNITAHNLNKLQVIQNSLCRVVKGVSRFDHITPHRKSLHWLPVKQRIQFKINLLTYKALNSGQPVYLANKLIYHPSKVSTKHLVLDSNMLLIPHKASNWRPSFFKRCFRVSAPTLWNDLPINIRKSPTVESFRRLLKAHLFALAYR